MTFVSLSCFRFSYVLFCYLHVRAVQGTNPSTSNSRALTWLTRVSQAPFFLLTYGRLVSCRPPIDHRTSRSSEPAFQGLSFPERYTYPQPLPPSGFRLKRSILIPYGDPVGLGAGKPEGNPLGNPGGNPPGNPPGGGPPGKPPAALALPPDS